MSDRPSQVFDPTPIFSALVLERLDRLESGLMTEATDQAKLDAEVADLSTAVEADRTELQAQIDALKTQAASGQPLDFSKIDALLATTQAEAAADAPAAAPAAAPADVPAPAAADVPAAPVESVPPAPVDSVPAAPVDSVPAPPADPVPSA